MDALEVIRWIAIPAGGLLLGFIGWAYLDGRDSLRRQQGDTSKALLALQQELTESIKSLASSQQHIDSKYAAEMVALRSQMQAMLLEVAKGYVPKDDLKGLEFRIMAAISDVKDDVKDLGREVRGEAGRISR